MDIVHHTEVTVAIDEAGPDPGVEGDPGLGVETEDIVLGREVMTVDMTEGEADQKVMKEEVQGHEARDHTVAPDLGQGHMEQPKGTGHTPGQGHLLEAEIVASLAAATDNPV